MILGSWRWVEQERNAPAGRSGRPSLGCRTQGMGTPICTKTFIHACNLSLTLGVISSSSIYRGGPRPSLTTRGDMGQQANCACYGWQTPPPTGCLTPLPAASALPVPSPRLPPHPPLLRVLGDRSRARLPPSVSCRWVNLVWGVENCCSSTWACRLLGTACRGGLDCDAFSIFCRCSMILPVLCRYSDDDFRG